MVKHLPTMQETWVWSLSQEYPLEKEIATHSSILAWEIPWTEEPGRLQSMGSQRVGPDSLKVSDFPFPSPTCSVQSGSLSVTLLTQAQGIQLRKQNYAKCMETRWRKEMTCVHIQDETGKAYIFWAPKSCISQTEKKKKKNPWTRSFKAPRTPKECLELPTSEFIPTPHLL